jgi:type I restriction enzyme, S subunit
MRPMHVKSLAELAESIQYGYTESATNEPIGPHFLRITDIIPPQINWDTVPYCKIDEKNKERFCLAPNDIVIARTGATVGYAKLIRINPESVFASYLVRIRIDPNRANPEYIGRIVESNMYKNFVLSRVGGAAQPNANAKVLSAFCLPIPERLIQSKIVVILSAYDDLIENNRRRIQLLEQAARHLYKEWFVHLRFPGHEHIKIIDGVPEGWEKKPLGDLLTLQRGFDLPVSKRQEGLIPIYASTGINGYHIAAKVNGPGVVTGRSGSLGTVMYVPGDFWPLNTALWVKEFKLVGPLFVTHLLMSMHLEQYNGGAAVPTLNRNDVHRIEVVCPSQLLLTLFDEHAKDIADQIDALGKMSYKLAQARDLLLPRLMNGEIAV